MIGIQGNFNKMPIPIPQSIPQPSEQEEIIEDQNLENIDGQDYITEVLNISKIKEGFYIGDKIAAISIEVVVQFKLTHMINASGNQIINQWETIGMKYLTLNWSENPNQILFDPNDEIADKILFFIDDSFINGEGLLAHSFKGQNRVCIVVLIYLMKKYKWSLKKSMEYLKSKKQDVDIPPFFLSQLIKFESRLIQRGELTKDIPWSFENLKDPEEKLLRNTYMNGLNIINKQNKTEGNLNANKSNIRHIMWADLNPYQQMPISVIDLDKDLFFKNTLKPIYSHLQKKVLKPCIKSNKSNEEKINKANNLNNNILNNIIKKNLLNSNNMLISSHKGSKKNIKNNNNSNNNNEELIDENIKIPKINNNNNNIPNKEDINDIPNNNVIINNIIQNKSNNQNNKIINKNEIMINKENDNNIINNKNAIINNGIANKNIINNIPIKKNILNNSIPNKNRIIINNMSNKAGKMNNNYLMNINNNSMEIANDNQIKKTLKRNMSESQQIERQNQNNFFINSYNLSNNNYNENIEPNIRMKNEFNNNNDNNQINNLNKFVQNEIINYKIYDGKENKMNNKININNKRAGFANPERNNIKEENIIIIANKYDNIIKNNINNYYINQIGTINNNNANNNINNSGNNINNSQNINNYNYQNSNNSNMNNIKQNNNNFVNENNIESNNLSNNLHNNNIDDFKRNNNDSDNSNKNNFKLKNNINKKNSNSNNLTKKKHNHKKYKENNKNMDNENDLDEIPQDINLKEFRSFNNTKILKNNIKNILGNNHKQILGINNNDNYYFLGQNYNTSNNLDSNITPKNTKNSAKIITNLSNNSNGKKFKIIDNTNLNNYNTNNNSTNSNKKNHAHINHNKENRNRHNHNYNVIINTRKGYDNIQNLPNQFLGRTSPKNSVNNNFKYDPIISNYNPVKKNKNINRSISSNSKTKNYQSYDNYENSNNINNINVNNYNISSNKPLNNFNPNLIKRKGTPTAGHQMIKINNINNNPVKIKNSIFINNKKPSTPDMIINKSATMVNNNSYIGPKINNTNNLFNYNINKSAHINNNSIYGKLKKNKNYNNSMQRPATAPHKDKSGKEKRGSQVYHIKDTKIGINNYNKNIHKANQRPASAGQGKYNHKEKEKEKKDKMEKYVYKFNTNNLNGINIGKKIEIDFGNKYKNSFTRKRLASPQISNNNKMSLGNNNGKINAAKYRLPSPMIKSNTAMNGKGFVNDINRSNTNYNMNKSASFNIK